MSVENFLVVETEHGPVKGIEKLSILGRSYFNFQGIPYMKAPVGKLRFRDAQAPEKWSEPFDASHEPSSYRISNFLNYKIEGKEDAGIINVYTPYVDTKKPLSVMVWIHGGGFYSGSSKTDLHGPDFFMQKDIVLVTFNYRVGAIGFLSLEDKELNIPGNAGLKDQTFALKWVQQNILNFGGDVNNITLFGNSAGAASTHYHMISDISKGLFHRSIVMSGCSFNSCFALIPRRDFAQRLAKALGWDGTGGEKAVLELLESVEVNQIVDASQKLLTEAEEFGENLMIPFGPTIEPYVSDNCFVPENPVLMAKKAWSNQIDSIIGVTSFEGLFRAGHELEKATQTIQDFDYFTPLRQLGVELSKDKISEYGTKIKEIYYGKMKPTVTNVESYYHFLSDIYFLHGIQRAVLSRVNSNAGGQTFFYRFDCDSGLNFVKRLTKTEEFPGSAHWDDLTYLWWSDPKLNLVDSPKIDNELKLVNQMINVWTNFAINGNTDSSETSDWKALKSNGESLKCLNISNDTLKVIVFPEAERLKTWDEMFRDAKANLF